MSYIEHIADLVGINKKDITVKITPATHGKAEQGHFGIIIKTKDGPRGGWQIATFNLLEMPGCCGILISSGAWIHEKYRGKGLGTLLNKMRATIARKWGYSLLFCTDITENKPQQAILSHNGWRKLTEFVNKRTGNKVAIHALHLDNEEELGFAL